MNFGPVKVDQSGGDAVAPDGIRLKLCTVICAMTWQCSAHRNLAANHIVAINSAIIKLSSVHFESSPSPTVPSLSTAIVTFPANCNSNCSNASTLKRA